MSAESGGYFNIPENSNRGIDLSPGEAQSLAVRSSSRNFANVGVPSTSSPVRTADHSTGRKENPRERIKARMQQRQYLEGVTETNSVSQSNSIERNL